MDLDSELEGLSKQTFYRYFACDMPFVGTVVGDDLRCTLHVRHTEEVRHYNHEAKVSWW